MENINNNVILVPTDFSEVGNNAVIMGAETAQELNYKLVLLHVIDKNTKADLKKENLSEEDIKEKLGTEAVSLKEKFNIEVETLAIEGNIFNTISEVADEIKAGLIYIGTHGKVGMQKLTGSFILKVIESSNVPVITVQKRKIDKGVNNMVLPITSDAGPWEKTKWAAFVAKKFNAKIHVFHTEGEQIEDALTLITNHFKANEVEFETIKADKSGNFTKQVIDYSTSINSEMILIMTNPDKGLKTFIMGSYDEDIILNSSQIPVMCINPRDFNWKKIVTR
ncbi:MAG: universal stress protein [Hyphomicrobiales bacterium]